MLPCCAIPHLGLVISWLVFFFCIVFAKKNSDFRALKHVFTLLHFYLLLGPVCPVLPQVLKAVPLLPLCPREAVRGAHALHRDPRSRQGMQWRWEGPEAEEQARERLRLLKSDSCC